MTSAFDAFAAYLDLLVGTLDEPVDTPTLAARLYLSRTSFDRIVSAAAGEPPTALRRRILMERAAYRLIASDHDVLRIAIDAGYASHEAFTRAFHRAYGLAPVQWRRRRPERLWLGGPDQVHFHPPGGLRVPARRKESPMDLTSRMIEHHIWLVGQLLQRAQRLDPEQLNAPIEISVEGIDPGASTKDTLARLVGQLAMWNATVEGRTYDFDAEKQLTIADLQRMLDTEGPAFLDRVRTVVGEGRLDETFVDALCEPARVFTYGGMFAHVLTFSMFRRLMVLCALDVNGITDLGSGDPMRWVADPAQKL